MHRTIKLQAISLLLVGNGRLGSWLIRIGITSIVKAIKDLLRVFVASHSVEAAIMWKQPSSAIHKHQADKLSQAQSSSLLLSLEIHL